MATPPAGKNVFIDSNSHFFRMPGRIALFPQFRRQLFARISVKSHLHGTTL
jgi:hypothetical protein